MNIWKFENILLFMIQLKYTKPKTFSTYLNNKIRMRRVWIHERTMYVCTNEQKIVYQVQKLK